MMKTKFLKTMKSISFYLLLFVLWAVIQHLFVNVFKWVSADMFVSPFDVLVSFYGFFICNANSFWNHIGLTLVRLFSGFALSLITGIILAAIMERFKFFRSNIRALLTGIQSLPNICWVPFAIIFCGLDERAVFFVIILGSAPSIALAIEASIRNVDPIYVKAGRTLGCNKIGMYTRIYIPASMPSIILGMKQGWAFSWRALMAGEMNCLFSSQSKGLGYLMYNLRFSGQIDNMLCIMIVLIIIGMFFEKAVFGKAENMILRKRGLKRD